MTPPRWLREQRRARARLDRQLQQLPAAVEDGARRLASLQKRLVAMADVIDVLDDQTGARINRLTSLVRDLAVLVRDRSPADVEEGRSWSWSIGLRR